MDWRYLFLMLISFRVYSADHSNLEIKRLHRQGSSLERSLLSLRHGSDCHDKLDQVFDRFLTYVDTVQGQDFIGVCRKDKQVSIKGRNNSNIIMYQQRKIIITTDDADNFVTNSSVVFIRLLLTYVSSVGDSIEILLPSQKTWKFRRLAIPGTSNQSYVVGELC